MFDPNKFKRQVKDWIRDHPEGEIAEFQDYCEEQVPPAQFTSYSWLIEQSIEWYRHILTHREIRKSFGDEGSDESIA